MAEPHETIRALLKDDPEMQDKFADAFEELLDKVKQLQPELIVWDEELEDYRAPQELLDKLCEWALDAIKN